MARSRLMYRAASPGEPTSRAGAESKLTIDSGRVLSSTLDAVDVTPPASRDTATSEGLPSMSIKISSRSAVVPSRTKVASPVTVGPDAAGAAESGWGRQEFGPAPVRGAGGLPAGRAGRKGR